MVKGANARAGMADRASMPARPTGDALRGRYRDETMRAAARDQPLRARENARAG